MPDTKTVTVLNTGRHDGLDRYMGMLNAIDGPAGTRYDTVAYGRSRDAVCNEDSTLKTPTDILVVNGGVNAGNIDVINNNLGKGIAIVVATADTYAMKEAFKQHGIKGVAVINDFAGISTVDEWKAALNAAVINVGEQRTNTNFVEYTPFANSITTLLKPSSKVSSHGESTFKGLVRKVREFVKDIFSGDSSERTR